MSDQRTSEELKAQNKEDMWAFKSHATSDLIGKGTILWTTSPIPFYSSDWIKDREVSVNGKNYKVLGLIKKSPDPLVLEKTEIGLLVSNHGS